MCVYFAIAKIKFMQIIFISSIIILSSLHHLTIFVPFFALEYE